MYKKIITFISPFIVIGCASTQPPVEPKRDIEPILVGVPMNEKISSTQQTIDAQFDLLAKIKSGQYVGKFEMVDHNNNLDARKNSRNTLPQAYAQTSVVEKQSSEINIDKQSVTKGKDSKLKEEESCNPKLLEKVKLIVWDNDSVQELGKLFAQSIGYTYVTNTDKDFNINLKIENETIESAIKKYKLAIKDQADVLVVDKNKTFNVIFKN